jgi:hypothetical protein
MPDGYETGCSGMQETLDRIRLQGSERMVTKEVRQ